MKPIERSFQDWERYVFGFGYGTGEQHVLRALKAFFDAFGNNVGPNVGPHSYDYEKLEKAVGPQTAWLLINILCRVDIIEYGVSSRYGWLTREGTALREFIANKTVLDLERICDMDDADDCAPDVCNCGPNGYEKGRKCENPFWDCR